MVEARHPGFIPPLVFVRISFILTILFRTIFRQYDPSSLGCTTVTTFVFLSRRTTACSLTSPAREAQSAPSIPSSLSTSLSWQLLIGASGEAVEAGALRLRVDVFCRKSRRGGLQPLPCVATRRQRRDTSIMMFPISPSKRALLP